MSNMKEVSFVQPHTMALKPNEVILQGRTKKKLSCYQNFISYVCNFCDNTSIHGFKFFSERHRNFLEKIYWFAVLAGAILASGILICNTYTKWVNSPIVVTFATEETPIWKIPFPAVTICSEININSSYFNYTDVYIKLKNNESTTDEEDKYFKIYSLFCNEELEFINETETKFLSKDDFIYLINTYEYSDMVVTNCKWMGNKINCLDSLTSIATSEGLCLTFNTLAYDDIYIELDAIYKNYTTNGTTVKMWTLEDGYPYNADLNSFPLRTMISGVNGGFQIDFHVSEEDLDYLCTDLHGYKVALHHPGEIPDMDKYFRVPLNQVVVAGIRPRMITTSEEIISYSPEDRQCYVSGEKMLNSFRIYSQQNCLYECLANFTLQKCGCTTINVLDENLTCGSGSKRCVHTAKVEFFQQEVRSQVSNQKSKSTNQCGCLPACTSIEFDSEISQTEWNWRKINKIRNDFSESSIVEEKMHRSRLLVYYKDLQFMTAERHEMYGTIDFLANCGGLLGLCYGFSFTSVMEIIYYLTLRLFSNVYKFGWKLWSGARELFDDEDE